MDSKFFKNNRKKLVNRVGNELIIISANGLMQRSGDSTYPFNQDSNFYYLTGLSDLQDAILVIGSEEEFIILPKRSTGEEIFGGKIDCDEIAKISGIQNILNNKVGWDKYKKMQQSRKKIMTLLPSPKKVILSDAFYTNPARRSLLEKLKRINTKIQFTDIRPELMKMRLIKQPEEITAIRRAIEITADGIAAAVKSIDSKSFEYNLEAELDYVFKKNNVVHAFSPIISSGANACTLHNLNRQSRVENNQFLLLDVGAEYLGYSADVSRTYAVGTVSDRHKQVYNSVKEVQDYAIDLLKPDTAWRDWVIAVDDFMGKELIKLGLIKVNSRKNVHKYFSHGIGHSLGLDTHDVCDYKLLQENMVITVEPGIYIPEEGIGVRIEDDILITKNGAINLSEKIPYN